MAISDRFKQKSKAGFSNCVGCIDCMLVWISKPVEKQDVIEVGPAKFFCGRKKKFGLNFQGVCDDQRRFIDVFIAHPGSASDFTVWLDSSLRQKIEHDHLLEDGLVLYGDNAYINSPYMVTPFKAVRAGPKDDYNFYHSNLRINIECAFGMLVHRWSCLQKAMPTNFAIRKVTSLTLALCKLHNFCINSNDTKATPSTVQDSSSIQLEGGISMPVSFNPDRNRLDDLLDGGDFVEEEHRELRRQRSSKTSIKDLPIYDMLEWVESQGLKQPNAPRRTT